MTGIPFAAIRADARDDALPRDIAFPREALDALVKVAEAAQACASTYVLSDYSFGEAMLRLFEALSKFDFGGDA